MKSLEEIDEAGFYRIPEIREPTLFDGIVLNVVPKLFKLAEMLTLAGFVEFAAQKTSSWPLKGLSILLFISVIFVCLSGWTEFIKKMKFRRRWVMQVVSWLLIPVGFFFILAVIGSVYQFARAY